MLRRRVILAVIGVLLIGGTSAALAALTTNRPSTSAPGTAQINPTAPDGTATSTSGTQDGTATPSPSPTLPPSGQPSPTATQPSAPPTATSTPRTAPPPGQAVDLHGTITAVNRTAGTFTFRDNTGAVWTVTPGSGATYSGAATSFAGLRAGMPAEIHAQTTGGFNLLASQIDTQRVDN